MNVNETGKQGDANEGIDGVAHKLLSDNIRMLERLCNGACDASRSALTSCHPQARVHCRQCARRERPVGDKRDAARTPEIFFATAYSFISAGAILSKFYEGMADSFEVDPADMSANFALEREQLLAQMIAA